MSSFRNIDPNTIEYNMYDIIFKNQKIEKAIYNVYQNIDIINSGTEWREADSEMTKCFVYGKKFKHFKQLIQEIKKLNRYDYVLIDTEPKKSANTFGVLLASEEVIIPFTLESFGIQALVEMYDYVMQAKESNTKLNIKALVATKTVKRSKLENIIKEQAEKLPEPKLCPVSIPNSVTGASSVTLKNLPIVLTSKNKLAKAYEQLVDLLEFDIEGEWDDYKRY
ncbi:ParA family protein [Mesomycoplasma molare]|uniref:ParA family protein n=1 Tax=Mesomycoplasma molare TaxID=171288 RepID=A0ABY5TV04_9BACT|nr:ParA family protein [Mesomycoplasma molare]UWD34490.1 ParA family protein [Mesomycoplasma molare]